MKKNKKFELVSFQRSVVVDTHMCIENRITAIIPLRSNVAVTRLLFTTVCTLLNMNLSSTDHLEVSCLGIVVFLVSL